MDSFIARANLEHFHKLLATEQDEAKRATLLKLVAEEEVKIAAQTALGATSNGPPGTNTSERTADGERL